MPFLFRSKSSSGFTQTKTAFNNRDEYEDDDEEEEEYEEEEEEEDGDCSSKNSPLTTDGGNWSRNYGGGNSLPENNNNNSGGQLPPLLGIIMTALRRSLVTCSVDRDDDVASIDISWPTEVKHVSHVTFDRFNGFLGLPIDLQHKIPNRVLSASSKPPQPPTLLIGPLIPPAALPASTIPFSSTLLQTHSPILPLPLQPGDSGPPLPQSSWSGWRNRCRICESWACPHRQPTQWFTYQFLTLMQSKVYLASLTATMVQHSPVVNSQILLSNFPFPFQICVEYVAIDVHSSLSLRLTRLHHHTNHYIIRVYIGVRVFGVSATSMQCSYDERGNSVPTILLTMQNRLYSEGGLQAEGIFRINAENSQEEFVRSQLNKGLVPNGIDVHCLAGLIKAWLRELPSGVLDALTAEQVMQCNTEEECSKLVKLLPPMEAALLDWTINLMADVVQHQSYNKMNAHNIAMVFAPNMTQMDDPLTALMHAVQVMNFLKTLILKTIQQREEELIYSKAASSPQSPCTADPSQHGGPISSANSASTCLDSALQGNLEKQETKPSLKQSEIDTECRHNADWLSWRKGVRKVCRNSVFQLSKQISLKKTRA